MLCQMFKNEDKMFLCRIKWNLHNRSTTKRLRITMKFPCLVTELSYSLVYELKESFYTYQVKIYYLTDRHFFWVKCNRRKSIVHNVEARTLRASLLN